jgi:hypothetical protein
MTLNKADVITIPKWLVIVIIPLVLGGIGGYATSRFDKGRQEKQIEVNTKRLDVVESNKVDREQFIMIENTLTRIENKLDSHIDKK